MERFVNKLVDDPQNDVSEEALLAWQDDNEELPEDYCQFMIKYNGGFVYPDMFRHNVEGPDDVDNPTQLNHIYSWEQFVKAQSYVGLDWRSDFVAVGEDIMGNLVLMKASENDFGAIYFWYRNNDSWDHDDGPVPIGRIADSFKDFILNVLFPDAEGPDSRWTSFFNEGTTRKLELQRTNVLR